MEIPDMEFWIRSGILEKQGIRNLIKSNTWDENSLCSNSFISCINIRFRIPCFSKIPPSHQNSISGISCIFYPGGTSVYFRFSKADVPFAIPHKTKIGDTVDWIQNMSIAEEVLSSFCLAELCEGEVSRERLVRWWRTVKQRRFLERVFCALSTAASAVRTEVRPPAPHQSLPASLFQYTNPIFYT